MFPYLTKIIEIGLRWAAIIPFLAVPCLDNVDFYACLTPVLSLTIRINNSDRFQNKYGHSEWVILDNTDKIWHFRPLKGQRYPSTLGAEQEEVLFLAYVRWLVVTSWKTFVLLVIFSVNQLCPCSKLHFHWAVPLTRWRIPFVTQLELWFSKLYTRFFFFFFFTTYLFLCLFRFCCISLFCAALCFIVLILHILVSNVVIFFVHDLKKKKKLSLLW